MQNFGRQFGFIKLFEKLGKKSLEIIIYKAKMSPPILRPKISQVSVLNLDRPPTYKNKLLQVLSDKIKPAKKSVPTVGINQLRTLSKSAPSVVQSYAIHWSIHYSYSNLVIHVSRARFNQTARF